MSYYVGDAIRIADVRMKCLNLIVSSCGTGKTYFCANDLLETRPDVRPEEMIMVTSRSLAVDQQAHDYELLAILEKDDPVKKFWAGECDIDHYADGTPFEAYKGKVRIMTYDKIINIFFGNGNKNFIKRALRNVKIIVFDEIHSIYSDVFVSGMAPIQMWMANEIPKGDKLFLGLTATPGVLLDQIDNLEVCINIINDPIQRYKTSQLWCVDIHNMLQLVNSEFQGKTIMMCRSVRSCYSLSKLIPGSAVLTGRSGNDYIPCDMDNIRRAIINESTLPDDVRVLISTSTAREGFTFLEKSGIRNVVSFFHDEMHVHQFMGRCRFDVDNLVMVEYNRDGAPNTYFKKQEELFSEFFRTRTGDSEWFDLVADIVDHDVNQTIIRTSTSKKRVRRAKKPVAENPAIAMFRTRDSIDLLLSYVKNKFVTTDDREVMIYGSEMKNAILGEVQNMNIFAEGKSDISWSKFENVLKCLGFNIQNGRKRIDGELVRYKIIRNENGEQKE